MADVSADPNLFNPSEFTPEELLAARDFLRSRREAQSGRPSRTLPATIVSSSLIWRLTDKGGEARRVRCFITTGQNSMSYCCDPSPDDSDWFPCSLEELTVLKSGLPNPDQVIDPPPSDRNT